MSPQMEKTGHFQYTNQMCPWSKGETQGSDQNKSRPKKKANDNDFQVKHNELEKKGMERCGMWKGKERDCQDNACPIQQCNSNSTS